MDIPAIAAQIMEAVMSGSIFTEAGQCNIRIKIESILSRELDASLFPATEEPPQSLFGPELSNGPMRKYGG